MNHLAADREAGRLIIERSSKRWVDRFRVYQVIVNGEQRAELRRGESLEVPVEPGEIEIFLQIDWCRSRIVRVQISAGKEVRLACRPRTIVAAIYGIIFARKNYVHLEPASG